MRSKTEVNLYALLFITLFAGVGAYHIAQISGALNVIVKEASADSYDTQLNQYAATKKH